MVIGSQICYLGAGHASFLREQNTAAFDDFRPTELS